MPPRGAAADRLSCAPQPATRPPRQAKPLAIRPLPRAMPARGQQRKRPRRSLRVMTPGRPAAGATAAAHLHRPNFSATRPRRPSWPWPDRTAATIPSPLPTLNPRRKSGADSLKTFPFTSSKTPFCVDPPGCLPTGADAQSVFPLHKGAGLAGVDGRRPDGRTPSVGPSGGAPSAPPSNHIRLQSIEIFILITI